ncbi:right-handed parallel beta-helix repeat-containing protein [Niabella insulamsoli]|uniref:right-handed parallel beta-helix repeat-containing protein n=1 Tax=Niabella insulamsoli TaxID=3144874 RepID=UPI0031FD5C5F
MKNKTTIFRLSVLLVILLCGARPGTSQTIRYVKAIAEGAADGSSWSNASSDLQQAINNSTSGDEVWVAAGEYQQPIYNFFSMKEGVKILGGFPNSGNPTIADRTPLSGNTTILKGNQKSVIRNDNNGLTSTAVLDGFTITEGRPYGDAPPLENGGGIYNSEVSPTIRNCVFSNNSATYNGGGIFNNRSRPRIENCSFINNEARSTNGGGAADVYSMATYVNCYFSGNKARYYGGGYYAMASNSGTLYPAAVQLINCVLANNYATDNGGGIGIVGGGAAQFLSVINATIVGNTSGGAAQGIYLNNSGSTNLNVYNSIIYNNNTVLGTSSTMTQTNCLDGVDPLFATGYTLSAISPARNGGDNNFVPANISTDLAGNPRIMGTAVDIGAYEFDGALPVHFGTLNASVKNNSLHVEWTTESESNNDHFNIEISGDGQQFTNVATLQSKAGEGNSAALERYEWHSPITEWSQIFSLAMAPLFFLLVGSFLKRKKIMALLFSGLLAIVPACRKTTADLQESLKVFVRIQQVDKDGEATYSKVVQATIND